MLTDRCTDTSLIFFLIFPPPVSIWWPSLYRAAWMRQSNWKKKKHNETGAAREAEEKLLPPPTHSGTQTLRQKRVFECVCVCVHVREQKFNSWTPLLCTKQHCCFQWADTWASALTSLRARVWAWFNARVCSVSCVRASCFWGSRFLQHLELKSFICISLHPVHAYHVFVWQRCRRKFLSFYSSISIFGKITSFAAAVIWICI